MIICILQKGTMGTLWNLNSQEEQIIFNHVSHTDHSQLEPEQAAAAFLGTPLELSGSALGGAAAALALALVQDGAATNSTGVLGQEPC